MTHVATIAIPTATVTAAAVTATAVTATAMTAIIVMTIASTIMIPYTATACATTMSVYIDMITVATDATATVLSAVTH